MTGLHHPGLFAANRIDSRRVHLLILIASRGGDIGLVNPLRRIRNRGIERVNRVDRVGRYVAVYNIHSDLYNPPSAGLLRN